MAALELEEVILTERIWCIFCEVDAVEEMVYGSIVMVCPQCGDYKGIEYSEVEEW